MGWEGAGEGLGGWGGKWLGARGWRIRRPVNLHVPGREERGGKAAWGGVGCRAGKGRYRGHQP